MTVGVSPMLAALAHVRAFILYRKVDKHPVGVEGREIDTQNRDAWMTPETALARVATLGPGYGVGLVLHPELKIFCVDIDKALINGTWSPLAVQLCQRFAGCAIEVSLSGKALHIFGCYTGEMPAHSCKNTALHIELYHELRYIALTGTSLVGNVLQDCTTLLPQFIAEYFPPSESNSGESAWTHAPVAEWSGPDDDDDLLKRAMRMTSIRKLFKDCAQFRELHKDGLLAVAKHYSGDDSAADLAYFNYLAWLTGKNCERMLRIAQRPDCSLARDKWWSHKTYLRGTILKACVGTEKVYAERGAPAADPVPTEADPRPVILLVGGKLNEYAVTAEQSLKDSIYVRGGKLVRIGQAAELEAPLIKRGNELAVCVPATPAWLRRALMGRLQFWKYSKRDNEWNPSDCPTELADSIGNQAAWSTFQPLVAISSVPVLRPDMSVWDQPSYDVVTGVYYQPTLVMPHILPTPTRDDALQALARLYEPFNEFAFATDAARSVFLAHVISAVIRPSYDTSPVFIYAAPIPKSAKSLLSSMPNLIATGVNAAMSPYPKDGDELKKVLFSALLAGDSSLILDNVPTGSKVRAPGLCAFATAATYSDRILGASENKRVPNRCTVALTGNNIAPAQDLPRRSVVCRLDHKVEVIRDRAFRIPDLPGYVRQHRGRLIVDAMTIVRAYHFAGCPLNVPPLGSFEQWSRMVREPLMWLGMVDPVSSQETETEMEEERASLRAAFKELASITAAFSPAYTFSAAQIAMACHTQQTLNAALVAAGCSEPKDAKKSLGYWLRENRDQIAGGWRLEVANDGKLLDGVKIWKLTQVG